MHYNVKPYAYYIQSTTQYNENKTYVSDYFLSFSRHKRNEPNYDLNPIILGGAERATAKSWGMEGR